MSDLKITIIRSDRKTVAIEVRPGEVIARAPHRLSDSEIYGIINGQKHRIEDKLNAFSEYQKTYGAVSRLTEVEIKALTQTATKVIPERLEYYASKIGVSYGKITIRCQKTRWGSCSTEGNLNFNCLLMLLPPEVMDSVIVHELCHRKQMNHSPKFYAELEKAYPDYKRCDEWLRKNGNLVMARVRK